MRYKGRFILRDIILISLLAAMGIATKQIVAPIIMVVTSPLYIPAGTLAGGVYMMWPVIARGLVRKPGAALLCSFIQSIVVFLSAFGLHGAATFPVYLAPGLAIELVFLVRWNRSPSLILSVLAGLGANVAGSFMVATIMMGIHDYVLILVLAAASISGIIGGVMAFGIIREALLVLPFSDYREEIDLDRDRKKTNNKRKISPLEE